MHNNRTFAWMIAAGALALASCKPTDPPAPPVQPVQMAPAAEPAAPAASVVQQDTPATDGAAPVGDMLGGDRIFFCRTKAGKTIALHDAGATIRYLYTAANGAPEMALAIPGIGPPPNSGMAWDPG
ncbi:hypothetical protein QT383_18490 [Stenotrophomonas rhizophila]